MKLLTDEDLCEDFGMAPWLDGAEARASFTYPPLDYEFFHGEYSEDVERVSEILTPIPRELLLSPAVARTAHRMARKLETWASFAGDAPSRLAAVCLYTASYVNNDILASEEIQQATGIRADEVHSTYLRIHPDRAELIDMDIIEIIDNGDMERVFGRFPPDTYDDNMLPEDGENIFNTAASRLQFLKELCSGYCVQLHLPDFVTIMSHDIVDKAAHMVSPYDREAISAASVYWAYHFTRQPRSLKAVAEIAGLTANELDNAYQFIYSEGRQVVG